MCKKLASNKGFTLAELLLTAAILSFALSAILLSFITGIGLNDASRNLTTATSHAEFVMEDIRNTTFGNISTNITNGNWDWDAGTVALKGLHALNSESIATSVSGSDPVDVTVTVSWHDLNGRVRSFNLRTYISS